ncbi:50S ribosomal protein L24 [Legionella sainthelensi]|uniref:Large ribosomal subunit protein uL24 n=1 Tax=Legionella sainthelensi TaxID=28087 RepID=A0A0W0YNX2_9GAMM|nr:50S ribosomal protein L24 [Legionella sainthelensi]AUH71781.1 50S ribosomal protein L24 [Legionella sainthelensi]KTD58399.1 50S ribosomal protein L24 [Legionella sainthelensi]VEB33557.1 50S ribosomal protein L24 [Legionella sainthelensi]VEH28009.1 50S ribosomal protein L24 [Legionella sainthelensi]
MKRIQKGDEVIIIAGKSKGHKGKVLRVTENGVVVEGGNLIKKHVKANPQKPEHKGGIITLESPVHVSNVAHYNPNTQKADKVGFKFIESNGTNKKVRYFKSDNEIIDRV